MLGLAVVSLACGRLGALGESRETRWLQEYLRLDTSNPPGDERAAAEYLAGLVREHGGPHGVETRLLTSPAGRTSLHARLPGSDPEAGSVVLLHHIDVVPPGEGWSVDPFGGEIEDDRVWGRGAVDAKGLGIAHLGAFLDLAAAPEPPRRSVVFLAVADEESGGGEGTAWLLEAHPELFADTVVVLGEGGVNRVVDGELRWWGIEVSQKRPLWLALHSRGLPGHGSGFLPHSASHKLIRALADVLDRPPRYRVDPPVARYLEAMAPLHPSPWRELFADPHAWIGPEGPTGPILPGMANLFVDSIQVTILDAGERINVVPPTAHARIDVRLLPETDADAYLEDLHAALDHRAEVEVVLTSGPAEPSPDEGPLWDAFAAALDEAPVVPVFIGGFTDSRYFRERGIPAYGLSPFALGSEDLRGIHAADERLPVVELDRGVERMRRIVEKLTR